MEPISGTNLRHLFFWKKQMWRKVPINDRFMKQLVQDFICIFIINLKADPFTMKKYLKEWSNIKTEVSKPEFSEDNEAQKKEHLIELASLYREKSKEFERRQLSLVNNFDIPDSEKYEIKFGVHKPSNKSLRKYFMALNKDQELIRISKELKEIILTGNLLIMNLINKGGVEIGGCNIKAFINRPDRYYDQIQDLILGFWGYEHIHVINNKIMFEMPARNYLNDFPEILSLVDTWINGLGIIESN